MSDLGTLFAECAACEAHGKLSKNEKQDLFGGTRLYDGLPKGWKKTMIADNNYVFCGRCTAELNEALMGALLRLGAKPLAVKPPPPKPKKKAGEKRAEKTE